MTNTSFSSGFSSGLGLGALRVSQESNQLARQQQEMVQQQQQQEQRSLVRQNLLKTVQDQMKFFADNAKQISASALSTAEPGKRERIIADWGSVVEPMNSSMDTVIGEAVKNGLFSQAEGDMLSRNLRISQRLQDPVAEKKLESEVDVEQKRQESKINVAETRQEEAIKTAEQKRREQNTRLMESHDIEKVWQGADGNPIVQTATGFYNPQTRERLDAELLRGMTPMPTTQNIKTTDLTTATQSGIQKDQIEAEELATEARGLANRITASDVGLRGAAGEVLMDQLLGQIFESAVNKDRVKNRQGIRTLREKFLRTMTTDNRLNREDRAGVEKIFPKDTVLESVPAVREKLEALALLSEERAARAAGRLGRKATHVMSVNEIVEAIRSGVITQDQGAMALRIYHGYE